MRRAGAAGRAALERRMQRHLPMLSDIMNRGRQPSWGPWGILGETLFWILHLKTDCEARPHGEPRYSTRV